MADSFIGEIRLLPYAYAPEGWAWCNGQVVNVQQNPALYAVIGILYGGDGHSNFKLPDLQGRVPLGYGQGPGLSNYPLARPGGTETVSLTKQQIPAHTHETYAVRNPGASGIPDSSSAMGAFTGNQIFFRNDPSASLTAMSPAALAMAGSSAPHENRQPFLAVNFCISLTGFFPVRP